MSLCVTQLSACAKSVYYPTAFWTDAQAIWGFLLCHIISSLSVSACTPRKPSNCNPSSVPLPLSKWVSFSVSFFWIAIASCSLTCSTTKNPLCCQQPLLCWKWFYLQSRCWRDEVLEIQPGFDLGPLNSGQMLLPTEPLELWVWNRR